MEFLHRTWAEIDVDALVHNFGIIKKEAAGAKIMAVVKADAYGHSARNVAPLLEAEGADAFAVSNIEEAVTLRGCGITKPILILGYTPVSMASQLYINDITQSVYSPEYAAALSQKATADKVRIKIHIKLDTGMSRIGFDCRDNSLSGIDDAIAAARLPGFDFGGIFTHFAVSDRIPQEEDGFTAEREMKTATVTAGYADGYPRLLSNKGYVLIKGKKAPIIGRICMDQMSVDVTDIEDVKQGDEVILFGKELPVEELADMCGTINYEIICGISPRVPRIIIKNSAI